MVEKSWKYRQIKHKKHFREKRKTSFYFGYPVFFLKLGEKLK
jgi:hypothetical protein